MRNFFTLLLLFGTMCLYAQTTYWSVYHFKVKPGQETEISNAFDQFFNSETGKKMTYAAFSSGMFSSSEDRWTHELLFATPNKDDFGKMYSGMLQQSVDFALLGQIMDHSIEGVASYLGKSLLNEPIPGNNYSTVYELSVSDPATYLAAFKEMSTALKDRTGGEMGLDLHQFISGNEQGATHVAVATAPTFVDLLEFTDMVFSSDEFKAFSSKVKDIRKVLRVFTTYTIKEYNVPSGM